MHLDVSTENIAEELTRRPQWLVWRWEKRGDDWTKAPYRPNGHRASSTDSRTWCGFEAAQIALERGEDDGLGFAFSADDPYTGVDLDKCRDPETGEIAAWAQEIMDRLEGYAEISPSGTGVHVIVRGRHTGHRHQRKIEGGKIEVYDKSRYFTITGNVIGDPPNEIPANRVGLDWLAEKYLSDPAATNRHRPHGERNGHAPDLTDAEIIEKCRSASNRDKFERLWSGDTSGYSSRSEADLALVAIFKFYSQDEAQLDSLFRQSGLMREKWDEKRGSQTYGQRTISRALQGQTATYSGRSSKQRKQGQRRPETDEAANDTGGGNKEPDPPPIFDPDDKRGLTATIADAITTDYHFARDASGRLFVYEAGVYKPNGDEKIGLEAKRLLVDAGASSRWSTHRSREVVAYISVDAPRLWEKPPPDWVNVRNGILDVNTRELRDHTPDYLSPVQLPVSYDADATCRAWNKFVREVFPEDARELAFEIPALLMTPETSMQKAVLLLGEGGAGKSTYLAALEAFVGRENAANLSLHKIEGDKFAAAALMGKLANVCADLPSDHLASTSIFKAITGGDRLYAERKYAEGFSFQPFARLVFSANHPPRSADSSHAFFRRWCVIPFDRSFEEGNASREKLDADLADPSELSGVLNRALDALDGIRERGEFTEPESVREARRDFQTTTDPFAVWLDRHTVDDPEAIVGQDELRRAYNQYAENTGKPGMFQQAFGRSLSRARPDVQKAQRTYQEREKVRVYAGIGLRKPGDSA